MQQELAHELLARDRLGRPAVGSIIPYIDRRAATIICWWNASTDIGSLRERRGEIGAERPEAVASGWIHSMVA